MTINKVATGAYSNNLRVLYVGAGGGGGGGGRAHQYESNGSITGGGGAGGLFTKPSLVSAGQSIAAGPELQGAGGASKTQGQNGNATSINAAGIGQTSVAGGGGGGSHGSGANYLGKAGACGGGGGGRYGTSNAGTGGNGLLARRVETATQEVAAAEAVTAAKASRQQLAAMITIAVAEMAEMATTYRMALASGPAAVVVLLPDLILAVRAALAAVEQEAGLLMDMVPLRRPRNRVAAAAVAERLAMAAWLKLARLALTASASFLTKFRG